MSLIKQITNFSGMKFTPASAEVNWQRIETLVHGPGAGDSKQEQNSALFACLMVVGTSYPEPPLTVFNKVENNQLEAMPDHPMQEILEYPTPNGELSMDEILFWTAWAKHLDGNAYWLKVRSGNAETGNVIQLWPISPTLIKPVTLKDSQDWISFYEYQYAPGKRTRVPVGNIIHFRLGLDDKDMRKGLAPFKALVRQISTDEEADKFMAALLANYAVPGLVVIPSGGQIIEEDDGKMMERKLSRKFGSDNRGNVAVMSKESKIEQFGFSPKDLDMSILHRIPEERISAVIGVPAILANLGAGLERSTFSNTKELGEMFTERKLVPQWRADAAKLNVSLRPDFTSDRNIVLGFDLTNVRALQEDVNAKYERLQRATNNQAFMLRNEARTEVGLEPLPEWEDELALSQPPVNPQEQPPQVEQQEQSPQAEEELRTWRRWAIRKMQNGGMEREFLTKHISPALAGAIEGALDAAKNVEDVISIFDDVWVGYP